MLDSDIGNTVLPMVRFYQKETQHPFNSEKENRPVFYMADFVRIEIPGNQYSIIDTFAGEHHKKSYPEAWSRYQNEKRELGDDGDITGTLLKDWSLLNPAQARELKHFHFYTVEQVANASDAQLSHVKMIIGMGEQSFREKARAYLAAAKGASAVEAEKKEVQKREEQINQLQEQLAKQQEQMQELMARLQTTAESPKRRGRSPKEKAPD